MQQEFSLSLRNIKRLANPSNAPEENIILNHKQQIQQQRRGTHNSSLGSQNGLHVSDYTDKDKSRNEFIHVEKKSKKNIAIQGHHEQIKSIDAASHKLMPSNQTQYGRQQTQTLKGITVLSEGLSASNQNSERDRKPQNLIHIKQYSQNSNEYYDGSTTRVDTASVVTAPSGLHNPNGSSLRMPSFTKSSSVLTATLGSSMAQTQSLASQEEKSSINPKNIDTLHTVLVKAQQWSASKEKQIKELAQDQIRRGLIIPNSIQSAQYDIRSGSLSHTQRSLHGSTAKKHGSSKNLNMIDEHRKSEIKQRIQDLISNSGVKPKGSIQKLEGFGSAVKSETERALGASEVKRNLLISYSQKSLEKVRLRRDVASLDYNNSNQDEDEGDTIFGAAFRQRDHDKIRLRRAPASGTSGTASIETLTKRDSTLERYEKEEDPAYKLIFEMHQEERKRQNEHAYKTSEASEAHDTFTKSKQAFRIRSGARGNSNRRAMQAHTKQQEEKQNSEMVKYLKKNSVIESINNNQSSAGPPNGHIKRIQSAYNQKAMATCTTEVFNSDIDILDTDGALSNGQGAMFTRQGSTSSQNLIDMNFQSTKNRLFSLAGVDMDRYQHQKMQANTQGSKPSRASLLQRPSTSLKPHRNIPLASGNQTKAAVNTLIGSLGLSTQQSEQRIAPQQPPQQRKASILRQKTLSSNQLPLNQKNSTQNVQFGSVSGIQRQGSNSQSARNQQFQSTGVTGATRDKIVSFNEANRQKLLIELYEAKCKDLLLRPQKEQEKRFLEFCQKTISNRRIVMRECGLGEASAQVLSQIITGDTFSHLDIGKNNLGNAGLSSLLKGIRQNFSLIHLDLGSNDITFEGAIKLFKTLESHQTISSLTLANHDRLHRNRMGFKACEALNSLLRKNKILSQLNISDNAISNEGLRTISQDTFTKNSNLVILNMSNNELQGAPAIQCFTEILSQSKSLLELNLSDNQIGDAGVDELTKMFTENASRLTRLILSNIGCTSSSVGKLFFSLKSNNFMTMLNLDGNDLSHQQFDQISLLLWNNRKLQTLELRNCCINNYGSECIVDGMAKNTTLKQLDLTNNKITAAGVKKWAEVLGKTGLTHLDLSSNEFGDEGTLAIVKGLSFGPTPPQAQVHAMLNQQHQQQQVFVKKLEPFLTFLGLKGVNMKDGGGSALSQMMSSNTKLTKIVLDSNTVSHRYIEEILAACARNRAIKKNNTIPKYKDELGELIRITKEQAKQQFSSFHSTTVYHPPPQASSYIQHDQQMLSGFQSTQPESTRLKNPGLASAELPQQLQLKRMNCMRKIKTLHIEKDERVKEIYEGEDILQDLQDQDEELHRQFRLLKEQNDRQLAQLDAELQRMEKKVHNKELWVQEQLDNIDRRLEYVKAKSARVQKQIDHEHEKIGKEKEKYKDREDQMRSQLEEVEKENRLAAVLHKTYVDQIEREKKKLIEDTRKHSSSNSSHAVSVNEHHSHSIEEQEKDLFQVEGRVRRNNEGKVCNKQKKLKSRQGSKLKKRRDSSSNTGLIQSQSQPSLPPKAKKDAGYQTAGSIQSHNFDHGTGSTPIEVIQEEEEKELETISQLKAGLQAISSGQHSSRRSSSKGGQSKKRKSTKQK